MTGRSSEVSVREMGYRKKNDGSPMKKIFWFSKLNDFGVELIAKRNLNGK
jgi:hypothetical protein